MLATRRHVGADLGGDGSRVYMGICKIVEDAFACHIMSGDYQTVTTNQGLETRFSVICLRVIVKSWG